MNLEKLTTLLLVDSIEACLPSWTKLGYTVQVRVPEDGPSDFVILTSGKSELMLQTHKSLAHDLPDVSQRRPAFLLYADVTSLTAAKKALVGARVIVAERTTFYGAREAWLEIEGGVVLGLAEHTG